MKNKSLLKYCSVAIWVTMLLFLACRPQPTYATAAAEPVAGRYCTSYLTSARGRATNVERAASLLNGSVIEPESFLSFNAIVGDRTEERGFKPALIIVDGKFVNGIGGGVCQVSTTLYNAALRAGLRTQSVSHSLPVSYCPRGFDAAVSSAVDLVIYNDGEAPLTIAAVCVDKKLTVTIFGIEHHRNFAFWSKTIATVPADQYETVYTSETNPDGSPLERTLKEGTPGSITESYVTETVNGKKVSTKLRTSYYKPTKGIKEMTAPPEILN